MEDNRKSMVENKENTEEIRKNQAENEEYTVTEIIEELMADMSWEANPMYRMRALGFIKSEIFTAS